MFLYPPGHLPLLPLEKRNSICWRSGDLQWADMVEQIDNGKQLTRNRKFLTVVPVVL